MNSEEKFAIKAYLKAELAMLYHPNLSKESAMYKMRQWIKLNDDLCQAFIKTGANSRDHYYTPLQVELIVKYLGVPISYTL